MALLVGASDVQPPSRGTDLRRTGRHTPGSAAARLVNFTGWANYYAPGRAALDRLRPVWASRERLGQDGGHVQWRAGQEFPDGDGAR
jgi:hypothetical protein